MSLLLSGRKLSLTGTGVNHLSSQQLRIEIMGSAKTDTPILSAG
ncbi:hypothetical protein SUS17_666 [Sphingomonas sp. S17]|nr:hypothetical protein SUS17_666 [Sphingomonas sp. S17]